MTRILRLGLVLACMVALGGKGSTAAAQKLFRAYPHNAIAGVNLFESPNPSAADCEALCIQNPKCRSFEVGAQGCYGSSMTRLDAQEHYTYDYGYTLYELVDDPTHVSCLDCSFKTAGDTCGWVTLRDSDSCNVAIDTTKGIQPTCPYGQAKLESAVFMSAPYDRTSCKMAINVNVANATDPDRCASLDTYVALSATSVDTDTDPIALPFSVYTSSFGCVLTIPLSPLSPRQMYSLVVSLGKRAANPIALSDVRSMQCGDRLPVLQCPADVNVTLPTERATTVSVTWESPSPRYEYATRGHCDLGSFSCSSTQVLGALYPKGTTHVSYSCVDRSSLTAFCDFDINVLPYAGVTSTRPTSASSTTPTTTTTLPPCSASCTTGCYQGLCYPGCPAGTFLPHLSSQCQSVPDAPVDLAFAILTPSVVRVQWRAAFDDKYIAGFYINYRTRSGVSGGVWQVADAGYPSTPICVGCSVDYSLLSFDLRGLYPLDYEVTVQAYTATLAKGATSASLYLTLRNGVSTTISPASTTGPQPWTKPSTLYPTQTTRYWRTTTTTRRHVTPSSSTSMATNESHKSIVIASGVLGGVILTLLVVYVMLRTDVYRRARAGRAITARVDTYLKDLQALGDTPGPDAAPATPDSRRQPHLEGFDEEDAGMQAHGHRYAPAARFTINLDDDIGSFSVADDVCDRNTEQQRYIVIGPSVHTNEVRDE